MFTNYNAEAVKFAGVLSGVMRRARLWRVMRLVLPGLLFAALAVTAQAAAPMAPTNLLVDDVSNPVGTEAVPYFGWLDNDTNANEIQTGYEILVATNTSDLDANVGDMWDSGKASVSQENHVVYAGTPLSADTEYYWKVRTWDRDGNVGSYSSNANFEVGLLSNSDWTNAMWIQRNSNVSDDYTYYRKSTLLPTNIVARATVYVTSVHKYALYVNGTLVGKGPTYQYPQFQYYNAYDITSLITPGATNVFAMFNHWFGGGSGRPTSTRGVLMKAIIHYTDGTSTNIVTDGTWLESQATSWVTSSPSPVSRGGSGSGYVERIDARNLAPAWNTNGFDDSGWSAPTVIGGQPNATWSGNLTPDLARIVETVYTPVAVTNLGGGQYIVDMGKLYSGVPSISFSGGASGTVVNMVGGFALLSTGKIDTTQNQTLNLSYVTILNGSNYTYQAAEFETMRYFWISNSPMAVTTNNFAFVERNSRMNDGASSFTSSNATLNAVWGLMKQTIPIDGQEEFIDSVRQKGGFLGDGYQESIAAMDVEDERVMTRNRLNEMITSMVQWWSTPAANVGRVNACYPNDDNARDIPDYTQMYLDWVWEYYLQTGDKAFLSTNYTALTNIAQYVNRDLNATTGLITNLLGGTSSSYKNGIIDWPPNMRFNYDMNTVTGIGAASTVINGWAWEDYDLMSRMAGEIGNTTDSNTYRAMASALQTAMNANLLNGSGVYADGLEPGGAQSTDDSQHANAFPLSLGIVPPAKVPSVTSLVISSNMSVSALGIIQVERALGEANQGPALLNLFTNATNYGWARILSLNGTATWESWTANADGNSESHGWGEAGLDGYVRYILGVEPLKAQFEQVQIFPLDFGNILPYVSGSLLTDRGIIGVEWDRSATQYHLTATIPVNVTATVYVPQMTSSNTTITVDGVNITGTLTNLVGTTNGYLGVTGLGSGTHNIERTIVTSPVAGFSGTPTNGAAPLTVTFANLSSNATNYLWNFGDGNMLNTASGTNVTDIYTNAGNYTVILTATGLQGTNSLTNTAYITVTNPPPTVAGFSGTPTNGAALLTVTFTNLSSNATNYLWNFGDGNMLNTKSGTNVTDTYGAGNYTVILTAMGLGGTNSQTNTAYITVTNPPPPVAGFSGMPTNGARPLVVTFTNLSSYATNYLWNFGDGNMLNTTSGTNVTDTYTNAGNYTVILTATGLEGTNSQTNTAYIVVTNPPPPVAGFSGTPTNGAAPLTVTFTNLSSNATNYLWNFGNSNMLNTASSTNVTSTYTNAGNYTVILTATGLGGTNSQTNTAYIVVTNPPPVAGFSGTPTNGAAPLTVTFTNLSSYATNYLWNFGDGNMLNTASSTNVTDIYTNLSGGSYTVILTATGLAGTNSLTNTAYIVVTPPAQNNQTITNADTGGHLNVGTSWIGGVVPVSTNIALFNSIITGVNPAFATNVLGGNMTNGEIQILNPAVPIAISSGNTLTLNGLNSVGIDMSQAANSLAVSCSVTLGAAQSWWVTNGQTLTVNGTIGGSGSLTINSGGNTNGSVILGANNNNYSGGTLINAGIVHANASSSFGTGAVTNNGGTILLPSASGVTIGNNVLFTGTSIIDQNNYTGSDIFSGTIGGNGTVIITNLFIANSSTYSTLSFGGSMSGFTGAINCAPNSANGPTQGYVRIYSGNSGGTNAVFNLGASPSEVVLCTQMGQTANLGALTGGPGTAVEGPRSSTGTTTWSIGGLNTSNTFAGTIEDGDFTETISGKISALTKVGTGTLTLTGTNTYSGTTTISNGVLQIGDGGADGTLGTNVVTITGGSLVFNRPDGYTVSNTINNSGALTILGGGTNTYTGKTTGSGSTTVSNATLLISGSISNGPVNILNGGVLGGAGNIGGAVTNQSGGILKPGAGVGTVGTVLTINSNLTLVSGGTNIMKVSHNGHTNDQVVSAGVSYGGILMVITNAGDGALALGDSFKLFNAGTYTNSFTTSNLPPLGPGLVWSNSLGVNGSISVAAAAPTASFTPSVTNGVAPLTVTFTNNSSNATNYGWNFGDGNMLNTASGTNVTDTYTNLNGGTYQVILTAVGLGGTNTATNAIVVTAAPPVAGFGGSPTIIFVTQPVIFTNTSTGSITNWAWNFNNGALNTGSGTNVTDIYNSPGSNTVTLIVTGSGGSGTNTQVNYIVVKPRPVIGVALLSGTNLIFSGTNGVPFAQYRIFSTTNVAMPFASWSNIWTGAFDANGNYSYTNTPGLDPADFFLLTSP